MRWFCHYCNQEHDSRDQSLFPPETFPQIAETSGEYIAKTAGAPTYHVAPSQYRAEIEQHGLQPNRPAGGWEEGELPHGVYVFPSLANAHRFREIMEDQDRDNYGVHDPGTPRDIWEVDTTGHRLLPDPEVSEALGEYTPEYPDPLESHYTTKPIEPGRIKRIASAPTKPPNLREATGDHKCGNCKMFFEGKCWGYGNYKVDADDVCDSWMPESKTSKTAAPLHSLAWEPGNEGKGFLAPNGAVHTWNTIHDEPTHPDYLEELGKADVEHLVRKPVGEYVSDDMDSIFESPLHGFHIRPDGFVDELWDHVALPQIEQADPRLYFPTTETTWNFQGRTAAKTIYHEFRPDPAHPRQGTPEPNLPFIYDPESDIVHLGPAGAFHWQLIQKTPELHPAYDLTQAFHGPPGTVTGVKHIHGQMEWPSKRLMFFSGDPETESSIAQALDAPWPQKESWSFEAKVDLDHVAQRVYETVAGGAGITINLHGEPPHTRYGFAPDLATQTPFPLETFSPQNVLAFIDRWRHRLMEPDKFIGVWIEDGQAILDVTEGHDDYDTAFRRAWDGQQRAMFDNVTQEDVPVRGLDYEQPTIGDVTVDA
jgi:hypothetical protein